MNWSKKWLVLFNISLFCLCLSGCSGWGRILWAPAEPEAEFVAPGQEEAKTSAVPVVDGREEVLPAEDDRPAALKEVPGVELIWEIPLQPVVRYHVYYGTDPDRPDKYLKVPVERIEKYDDPSFGPVYRYRLKGVAKDRDVYVILKAENSSGISDPTPPIKIPAAK